MGRGVGHVMESRPGWNPMQRFGIGWAASDEVVNKRFDPYADPYVYSEGGERVLHGNIG